MKTKFKDSKIFKIIKAVAPAIPFNIGSVAAELLNRTDSPEGTMTREKAIQNAAKTIFYMVLVYMALTGKLTWSEIEQAQEFINK